MGEGLVRILDGATFAVSQGTGDIEPDPAEPTGLFSLDTRFISKWVLTVDGRRLNALSYDAKQYFESRFFLVPGPHTTYTDAQISVVRKRSVGGALVEELVILNHADHAVELRLRMDIEADFADIFQVKDRRIEKRGEYYSEVEEDGLRLGYRRDNFARETRITVSGPAVFDREGFTVRLRLEPHAKTDLKIHVDPRAVMPGRRGLRMALPGQGRERDLYEDLDEWVERAPKLNAEWGALNGIYQRCLVDLAALRFSPLALGTSVLPAAGLPWFMTMFGRDSIFTCLQTLPFAPHLSQTTLRILAALQGTRFDDFRDEDPGRILHEMRYGESAAFEEQPHSPYYGSVDATPLFVILLDEYERWSGDSALVQELEAPARAALNWIEKYADLVGDGYIWYSSRNDRTGLHNQCWKDSGDAISYRDGRLPGFPRATCELQGYAYDARIRGARLARTFWRDEVLAHRLERDAAELKARFNREWWVAEGEYYALGREADGRQVDALTSNIGHLLWSGIVEPERAGKVVEHLLGPRLFTGWGVRTFASEQARYNPVGYHIGTVWPFDNSFIAWGLRRYGFLAEAATLAEAILQAAEYFEGRLPEAFGGYGRSLTSVPVRYPTACSPQAWSTGAPLLMLRVLLGLEPQGDQLVVNPAIPERMGRMELLDIPGRWGRMDAFGRGRMHLPERLC
ncbi:glycogen debranching N-terminal domain-containing protein [Micromonosporaceae bacterium DT55]|uniref:amylo-alpha-1,6-glucosidase n=1 Tax=Melissospora conviva TaxID=3388432 RepID=UPI003C285A0F